MDTTKDVYTGLSDKADAMEYAISHVRDIKNCNIFTK